MLIYQRVVRAPRAQDPPSPHHRRPPIAMGAMGAIAPRAVAHEPIDGPLQPNPKIGHQKTQGPQG